MNISKIASKAEKAAIDSRYSCINWNAHLVPIVQNAIEEFAALLEAEGYSRPHLSLLSEAVHREELALDPSNHLGDSITVQFGVRPIATNTVSPLGKMPPILVETRAALVFSQAAASGSVVVLLYPPSSAAAEPKRKHYLVGAYESPLEIRKPKVLRYLRDLFEIDLSCSTQTAPSISCAKLLLKLEARATAIESGDMGIFRYAKYLGTLIRGLWHLYRSSHASP